MATFRREPCRSFALEAGKDCQVVPNMSVVRPKPCESTASVARFCPKLTVSRITLKVPKLPPSAGRKLSARKLHHAKHHTHGVCTGDWLASRWRGRRIRRLEQRVPSHLQPPRLVELLRSSPVPMLPVRFLRPALLLSARDDLQTG